MSRQIPDAPELLAGLAAGREQRLRHVERIPARAADEVDLPDWVAPPLRGALAGAVVAKAVDGNVATGALIGGAAGALCDDAGVCVQ